MGTSGHLLGAALAAILLGSWSACLILSTVLFIQCLAFQDGGLTALGANVFNMAVVGVLTAFIVYKIFSGIAKSKAGRNISVFLASWASVFAASMMATLELSVSNQIHLSFAQIFVPMAGWHAVIGIGEGLITVVVVNFVERLGFVDTRNNMRAEVKE